MDLGAVKILHPIAGKWQADGGGGEGIGLRDLVHKESKVGESPHEFFVYEIPSYETLQENGSEWDEAPTKIGDHKGGDL